jgi:hypothetical protein
MLLSLGKKITGASCEAYEFLFCALGKFFARWLLLFSIIGKRSKPLGKVLDAVWEKNCDSNFLSGGRIGNWNWKRAFIHCN